MDNWPLRGHPSAEKPVCWGRVDVSSPQMAEVPAEEGSGASRPARMAVVVLERNVFSSSLISFAPLAPGLSHNASDACTR